MNKKRILFVTTSDRMAGAEKGIFYLLKSINKSKYDPYLVVIKNEKNGSLIEEVQKLGIKAVSLKINSKWQALKIFKLWKIIKNYNPDILESFLFFDNFVCRIFGKIAGIKMIISGQRNVETRRSAIRNLLDRLTINFADLIISNSEAGKSFYVDKKIFPIDKIKVINNGIDIEDLEKQQTENEINKMEFFKNFHSIFSPKIVMIGFLTKQKGVTYLIRAMEILKKRGISASCFIIGKGDQEEKLKNEVRERQMEEEVHFIGYLPKAFKYLRFFDIFVLPSVWEGQPNVLMEAMASKLSVVATKVGGIPEIIKDGENGFLVNPESGKDLAEKIQKVISLKKEEREKMKESAYLLMKNQFSIDSMAREYEKYYE